MHQRRSVKDGLNNHQLEMNVYRQPLWHHLRETLISHEWRAGKAEGQVKTQADAQEEPSFRS